MCYSIYKGLNYEHAVVIDGKELRDSSAADVDQITAK
jgi:hypothetical protein